MLTVDFNASSPTGTGRSMRTLNVVAGSFRDSIPVAGTLAAGVTFRIVLDGPVVEVFGGATPVSFTTDLGGTGSMLQIEGGEGPFSYALEAHQVAPARVTKWSPPEQRD